MRQSPRATSEAAVVLICLLAAWALAGCGAGDGETEIGYCLAQPGDLASLSRVVMLELTYDGQHPRLPREMTEELAKAVRGRMLFSVEVVGGEDQRLRDLPARPAGPRTLGNLSALRRALGCDAVLVGSISHFQPYPHMQLGMCVQLLDLRRGRLIWGLEHTWDTADQATERRIQEFFRKTMRDDYAPLDWRIALMSPKVFQKFVACEVAGTLRADPLLVGGHEPPRR